MSQNWEVILLGEIFREEKRQVFVKRLVRQVRREFFSKDFKRLLHYKEILMNLEAVKNLEDVEALAQKIHREMKKNYFGFAKTNKSGQALDSGASGFQPVDPRFETSIINLSNTLGLKTQTGNLLSHLENDPQLILEQQKQVMISSFDDNFQYYQSRHLKSQGACMHFLNALNLQKRFEKLLHYDFKFAKEVPRDLGISFYDPLIKENVLLTFFPKGTSIPTKHVSKDFYTRSEVIKLKIVEGDSFLSCNCRCVDEFEIKLMDIIEEVDGFKIKMRIDNDSILSVSILNGKQSFFEIRLLYKVRPGNPRNSFMSMNFLFPRKPRNVKPIFKDSTQEMRRWTCAEKSVFWKCPRRWKTVFTLKRTR